MASRHTTLSQLQALRTLRYRRQPAVRLASQEDIRAFVDDVGICLLFPSGGLEIPNVYQAVAGGVRKMSSSHHDPVIGLTWGTKDFSLDKRWWYYGKLLRDKATLLSLEMLVPFYALSENYGSSDDYLEQYESGQLSSDAKNIYEALLKEGPLHAINLKRAVGLYGDRVKTKFDRAVNELQRGLKIMPVGVAEAGAWRYAFTYELVWRWLPEVPPAARAVTRGEARAVILQRHLQNVIFSTPGEIAKLFGWRAEETAAAAQKLLAREIAVAGPAIKGMAGDVLVYRPAIENLG